MNTVSAQFDTTGLTAAVPEKVSVDDAKVAGVSSFRTWTSFEFLLSVMVLVFGMLVILLEVYMIKTGRITAEYAIKFIILTLVITSTLFLITAGYSNTQIASAMGLLGTIAGYLLGRNSHSDQPQKN